MFSCRRAGQLISQSFDRKLSIFERMSLKGHLMMCKVCQQVNQKYLSLRIMLIRFNEIIESGRYKGVGLSASAIQKIKQKIFDESKKSNFDH